MNWWQINYKTRLLILIRKVLIVILLLLLAQCRWPHRKLLDALTQVEHHFDLINLIFFKTVCLWDTVCVPLFILLLTVYLKPLCCAEAAVTAGCPALQFGWRVSPLCQFLRGEAVVLQRSCPAVRTQSGRGEYRQTAQPLVCLPRKVSAVFVPLAYTAILFIGKLINMHESVKVSLKKCMI